MTTGYPNMGYGVQPGKAHNVGHLPGRSPGADFTGRYGGMGFGAAPIDPELAMKGNLLNWMKGQFGGGSSTGVGSKLERPKDIDTGGIWGPGQLEQRAGHQYDMAQRGAVTDQKNLMEKAGGSQGYGTQSPLAMAMQQSALGAGRQTGLAQQEDTLFRGAEAERDMRLKSQTAQGNQILGWDQVMNQDAANRRQYLGGLIGAMSGFF